MTDGVSKGAKKRRKDAAGDAMVENAEGRVWVTWWVSCGGFINLIDFGWIKRTRGAIRRRSGSQ